MLLHTKLSMAECLDRIRQPFLRDPYTMDTANTIRMPKNQTGKEYGRNWAIIIESPGSNFQVQERTWNGADSEQYVPERSEIKETLKCRMTENPAGGTDIEYVGKSSLRKLLLLLPIPLAIGLAAAAIQDSYHISIAQIPALRILLFLALFGPGYYLSARLLALAPIQRIMNYTAKLLDAKEVFFGKSTASPGDFDQDKPSLLQQVLSAVTLKDGRLLRTSLSKKECLDRLSQPFLSNPDTTETTGIIKRPASIFSDQNGNTRSATIVRMNGNDFEVQRRTWRISNKEQYRYEDSKQIASINCCMQENSNGGLDIQCNNIESTAKLVIYVVAALVFSWLPGMFSLREISIPGMHIPVSSTFFMVALLFIYWKFFKVMPQYALYKYTTNLLDAEEVK